MSSSWFIPWCRQWSPWRSGKKLFVIFTSSIYPLAPPTGQTDTWQGRFVLTHFLQWGPNLKICVLPIFSSATIKHITSNHSGKKKWLALFEKSPFSLGAFGFWPKIWALCLKLVLKNTYILRNGLDLPSEGPLEGPKWVKDPPKENQIAHPPGFLDEK